MEAIMSMTVPVLISLGDVWNFVTNLTPVWQFVVAAIYAAWCVWSGRLTCRWVWRKLEGQD